MPSPPESSPPSPAESAPCVQPMAYRPRNALPLLDQPRAVLHDRCARCKMQDAGPDHWRYVRSVGSVEIVGRDAAGSSYDTNSKRHAAPTSPRLLNHTHIEATQERPLGLEARTIQGHVHTDSVGRAYVCGNGSLYHFPASTPRPSGLPKQPGANSLLFMAYNPTRTRAGHTWDLKQSI